MTTPRNFPERVNQRRKDALYRMEYGRVHVDGVVGGRREYKDRDRDIAALVMTIINDARGIRTKKNRGARRV